MATKLVMTIEACRVPVRCEVVGSFSTFSSASQKLLLSPSVRENRATAQKRRVRASAGQAKSASQTTSCSRRAALISLGTSVATAGSLDVGRSLAEEEPSAVEPAEAKESTAEEEGLLFRDEYVTSEEVEEETGIFDETSVDVGESTEEPEESEPVQAESQEDASDETTAVEAQEVEAPEPSVVDPEEGSVSEVDDVPDSSSESSSEAGSDTSSDASLDDLADNKTSESELKAAAVPYVYAEDPINAISFKYPLATSMGAPISWVETRKPERYSSAAPLSPDARLRIVSERLSFLNSLVLSVYIGPPNDLFLKSANSADWKVADVARSVTTDRSTPRLTVGQRLQETTLGDLSTKVVDGQRYFYYEYINQKSPTVIDSSSDVFRHSVAVSTEREGYIYTLTASTLETKYEGLEDVLKEAIGSFKLTKPTDEYVPAWKDPWRFW